jgi:hypothetical protein
VKCFILTVSISVASLGFGQSLQIFERESYLAPKEQSKYLDSKSNVLQSITYNGLASINQRTFDFIEENKSFEYFKIDNFIYHLIDTNRALQFNLGLEHMRHNYYLDSNDQSARLLRILPQGSFYWKSFRFYSKYSFGFHTFHDWDQSTLLGFDMSFIPWKLPGNFRLGFSHLNLSLGFSLDDWSQKNVVSDIGFELLHTKNSLNYDFEWYSNFSGINSTDNVFVGKSNTLFHHQFTYSYLLPNYTSSISGSFGILHYWTDHDNLKTNTLWAIYLKIPFLYLSSRHSG